MSLIIDNCVEEMASDICKACKSCHSCDFNLCTMSLIVAEELVKKYQSIKKDYYFVKYNRRFDGKGNQYAYAIYDDYVLARKMYYSFAGIAFGKVDGSIFKSFVLLESREVSDVKKNENDSKES